MRKRNSHGLKVFRQDKSKDTNFRTQKEKVYNSISKKSKTMLMISLDIGVKRTNICSLISILRKEGRVKFIGKSYCKVSGYTAGYYISTLKDR